MFFGNATSSLWIAGGTVLVFSGLLVFDTWRLRNVYGPEDYVIAAVAIYLDLLNMFLAILRILGGGRRS
jgi:FtsH-binding integral membrane protein